MNKKIILSLFVGVIAIPVAVFAATDGTYNISVDNVGFAGGEVSGDGTYSLSDTVGEPLVGLGTSADFKIQDGFWYIVNNTLSLELDSNTKDLGTVTAGIPNTANTTAIVTTDAWGGYELLINQDNELTHETDAGATIANYAGTIASPTAWTDTGFGFTVTSGTGVAAKWGSGPYNYAGFTASDTVFHDKPGYTSGGNSTVIEYKIDVPSSQKSGTYNNVVTYTAISKL